MRGFLCIITGTSFIRSAILYIHILALAFIKKRGVFDFFIKGITREGFNFEIRMESRIINLSLFFFIYLIPSLHVEANIVEISLFSNI